MESWQPLAGVVVAQFVLVLLYFAKLRADDRRRWHERRLELYLEFQARVQRLIDHLDPESPLALGGGGDPLTDDERSDELSNVRRDIARMKLICPRRVEKHASTVWIALLCVFVGADDGDNPHGEPMLILGRSDLAKGLNDFTRVVRRSLGVPREPRDLYWTVRDALIDRYSAKRPQQRD